jgi:hypothetical protein
LAFGIGQAGQLPRRRVRIGRRPVDPIGGRFLAVSWIKRNKGVLILRIGSFDGVSCFVIRSLGNGTRRIGRLSVPTQVVIDTIGTDVVGVSDRKLVPGSIERDDGRLIEWIETANGSTCRIGPGAGGETLSIDGLVFEYRSITGEFGCCVMQRTGPGEASPGSDSGFGIELQNATL